MQRGQGRGRHNPRLQQWMLASFDAVLTGGLVARWSYAFGLHGRFGVTAHEIQLARGKRLPRPLVVAFASDFHAGLTTHPKIFSLLAEELTARQPDVILLGGDYVSTRADHVAPLADALSRCKPRLGMFGVLGNHDLWTDDAHIVRALTDAGVTVLINGNCALPAPFSTVSVCGIDDPWTGDPDAARAFAGAGPIRLFLTHSPDGLLVPDKQRFDAGFAGHTHGGQVALGDGTPILSAGGPLSRAFSRGRFEIPGNGPLIVSRGLGCSNLPIRVNAHPELVICTLRGAP